MIERENYKFPVAAHVGKATAGQLTLEHTGILDEIRFAQFNLQNSASWQGALQAANYSFDFRKLRHDFPLLKSYHKWLRGMEIRSDNARRRPSARPRDSTEAV